MRDMNGNIFAIKVSVDFNCYPSYITILKVHRIRLFWIVLVKDLTALGKCLT